MTADKMQPAAEPPAYAIARVDDNDTSAQPQPETLPTYDAAIKAQPAARPAMVAVTPADAGEQREWDAHLCGCCENSAAVKSCALAACCPCIAFGSNAERLASLAVNGTRASISAAVFS